MKLFFDFFPIFAFFIVYKFSGIYIATAFAMLLSVIQVIINRIKSNQFETIQLVGLAIILTLGGATLIFKNPWFIKWKPTGIYWITAIVFFSTTLLGKRPLIQTMLEGSIQLPSAIWQRLNHAWALFFIILGALNLYIAYYYTTDIWVNFKLFGGAGLTLLFVLGQSLFLSKYATDLSLSKQSRL